MHFNRIGADRDLASDFLICESRANQSHNLKLTLGEGFIEFCHADDWLDFISAADAKREMRVSDGLGFGWNFAKRDVFAVDNETQMPQNGYFGVLGGAV